MTNHLQATPENDNTGGATTRFSVKRLAPLIVIASGFIAFFALGLDRYLSFDTVREHHDQLTAWTQNNYILASAAFIGVYIVTVSLSLPVGIVLTPLGGFLFGTWIGGAYAVFSATIGSTVIFLAARYAFADWVRARAGGALLKMEDGFRENAFNYLLVLRLVPLFPFWLVNLVPGLLGVSFGTYVGASFIGMIPGALVYASVGNGLGAVFDSGGSPDLGLLFEPEIFGPILGLAVLSLVPVLYKKYRGR